LPAQAKIKGHLRSYFPVVLNICSGGVVALSDSSAEAGADTHVGGEAKDEIGFRISGVGSIEPDLSRAAIGNHRGNVIVAVTDELEAEFQVVRAVVPQRRILQQDGGLMEDLRGVDRTESERTVDGAAKRRSREGETREVVGWLAGHQRTQVRGGGGLDITFRGEVIHTDAKLIDDIRLHGLCVVDDAVPEREAFVAVGAVQHRLAVHELLHDVLLRVPHRHVIVVGRGPVELDVALIAIGEIVLRVGYVVNQPAATGLRKRLHNVEGDLA